MRRPWEFTREALSASSPAAFPGTGSDFPGSLHPLLGSRGEAREGYKAGRNHQSLSSGMYWTHPFARDDDSDEGVMEFD